MRSIATSDTKGRRFLVLGDANVGKSTLLNALVVGDYPVLPSAGVGPVTGAAVSLRYAQSPALRITYRAPQHLWCLSYQLEHLDNIRGGRAVRERDYQHVLSLADRKGLRDQVGTSKEQCSTRQASERIRVLQRCRLAIFGEADRPEPTGVLRASLRKILGLTRIPSSPDIQLEPTAAFRFRQFMRLGRELETLEFPLNIEEADDLERLKLHVSGALSVVTRSVEIGWPSPILRTGLVLTDLPGVGTAYDIHKDVTSDRLAASFDGLLVVCNRAGLTEASREALLTSGTLKQISESESGRHFCIVVAVTKLDDEARALQRQARGRSPNSAKPIDRFRELGAKTVPVIRSQLRDLMTLGKLRYPEHLDHTPVIAVAAPSYMGLRAGDPELSGFFEALEDTNVPRLARVLNEHVSHVHVPSVVSSIRSERRARLGDE